METLPYAMPGRLKYQHMFDVAQGHHSVPGELLIDGVSVLPNVRTGNKKKISYKIVTDNLSDST